MPVCAEKNQIVMERKRKERELRDTEFQKVAWQEARSTGKEVLEAVYDKAEARQKSRETLEAVYQQAIETSSQEQDFAYAKTMREEVVLMADAKDELQDMYEKVVKGLETKTPYVGGGGPARSASKESQIRSVGRDILTNVYDVAIENVTPKSSPASSRSPSHCRAEMDDVVLEKKKSAVVASSAPKAGPPPNEALFRPHVPTNADSRGRRPVPEGFLLQTSAQISRYNAPKQVVGAPISPIAKMASRADRGGSPTSSGGRQQPPAAGGGAARRSPKGGSHRRGPADLTLTPQEWELAQTLGYDEAQMLQYLTDLTPRSRAAMVHDSPQVSKERPRGAPSGVGAPVPPSLRSPQTSMLVSPIARMRGVGDEDYEHDEREEPRYGDYDDAPATTGGYGATVRFGEQENRFDPDSVEVYVATNEGAPPQDEERRVPPPPYISVDQDEVILYDEVWKSKREHGLLADPVEEAASRNATGPRERISRKRWRGATGVGGTTVGGRTNPKTNSLHVGGEQTMGEMGVGGAASSSRAAMAATGPAALKGPFDQHQLPGPAGKGVRYEYLGAKHGRDYYLTAKGEAYVLASTPSRLHLRKEKRVGIEATPRDKTPLERHRATDPFGQTSALLSKQQEFDYTVATLAGDHISRAPLRVHGGVVPESVRVHLLLQNELAHIERMMEIHQGSIRYTSADTKRLAAGAKEVVSGVSLSATARSAAAPSGSLSARGGRAFGTRTPPPADGEGRGLDTSAKADLHDGSQSARGYRDEETKSKSRARSAFVPYEPARSAILHWHKDDSGEMHVILPFADKWHTGPAPPEGEPAARNNPNSRSLSPVGRSNMYDANAVSLYGHYNMTTFKDREDLEKGKRKLMDRREKRADRERWEKLKREKGMLGRRLFRCYISPGFVVFSYVDEILAEVTTSGRVHLGRGI